MGSGTEQRGGGTHGPTGRRPQGRQAAAWPAALKRLRAAGASALVPVWLGLSLAGAWSAHAQTDPTVPPPKGEEQLLLQDIPSVYGASKYEQKATEAPSSVTIVTADEIKKFGYRTLADILRNVRSSTHPTTAPTAIWASAACPGPTTTTAASSSSSMDTG